jgi:predicted RNA-binding protein with PUA-like domain
MAYFLLKTDPQVYSLDDLAREGTTVWDGVRNAQAVGVIKSMASGDSALIYHSGGEAAIVGLAEIVSAPRPDPADPRSWVVDVRFAGRLPAAVTLQEIRATHRFDGWSLVRQGRLSTMTVPDDVVAWLQERGALTPTAH